jgi:hypothetical protein
MGTLQDYLAGSFNKIISFTANILVAPFMVSTDGVVFIDGKAQNAKT